MSNDEIIELARQAGFSYLAVQTPNDLIAFAKLVEARKTEEIARYCIWLNDEAGYTDGYDFANAIRVKGQT